MGQTEINLQTRIKAPTQKCFDLARDIDFHVRSAYATREQAVAGVKSGVIGEGQEVEWRARHFGLWFNMRIRITGFKPPTYFQDTMIEGPFRSFVHDHHFDTGNSVTLMTDRIVYASPVPIVGWILDRFILKSHLLSFVRNRNLQLKDALESNSWQPHSRPRL